MVLRIQLLGQPQITRDDQPVDVPGYRPVALLAYLLVTRKSFRREHLIDLLFDGPDDPQAALRWTLTKLRKAISAEYILADRQEVSFNFQSDYWLDVAAFEAGETELYKGDFLEGLHLRDAIRFEDWLMFERQRLRNTYQAALERQLESDKRQGDHAAVVLTAQQLLKLDDLSEAWHSDLIAAYARLGKRTAALEAYQKYRNRLRKELGAEPGPEITAVADAIRSERLGADRVLNTSETSPSDSLPAAFAPLVAAENDRPARYPPARSWRTMLLPGAVGLVIVLLLAFYGVFANRPPASANPQAAASGTDDQSNTQLFAGATVRVHGPFFEALSEMFLSSMRPFMEQTGIQIEFVSSSEPYAGEVMTGENAPDIVVFSQPGRLAEFARQGRLVEVTTFLDEDYLRQQYPQIFLDLASVDGRIVGVWYSAGIKSLVWYPKPAFDARGYDVPETWDELIALSDRIVTDGGTPWCIGIDDYDAPGWPGTDWVEDVLLRTAPPETYDAWTRHALPFNSPEIRRVFEIIGQIWLNEDYVYGGVKQITAENFRESPTHLFEDPPGCYLHRQASFIPIFFPPGVEYEADYDFFYLPPIDPQYGKPVLGSGDIFAMVNDRPEVREVMRYLTTPEATKSMIQHGGFLSPHRLTPIEWFPTPADLRFAQIILAADTYRFDGSDLMPEVVGYGTFFHGIGDWVNGADLETVLKSIDESWPPSGP